MNSLFGRLTLFLGMFFASVPGVVDAGGSGDTADTGGGDDGAAGGDSSGTAEETDDSGRPEDLETISEGDETGVSEDDEGDSESGKGQSRDQRMLPDAVKKGLNKLRETDPKLASELRKAYFESSDYKKTYATPGEARMAKETIEGLDRDVDYRGEQGIALMYKEAKDYATELTHFAKGNPQAVDDMARDFPQGLVKLTPYAVSKLQQLDPTSYTQSIAAPGAIHVLGMSSDSLNGTTPLHAIDRLIELIDDGKQVQSSELAKAFKKWTRDVAAYSQTKPSGDVKDEEREALDSERAEVQTEKQRLFTERVSGAVLADMDKVMTRHLQPFLKNRKLTSEQLQATKSDIRGRVAASLQSDTGYQSRLKALISDGDAANVQNFINSNFAQRAAKATAKVWALRGYAGSTARRAAGTGTNGSAAAVQSTKPNAEDIDWSKDPRRERYMQGIATLKNGKVVKWTF